MTDVYSVARYVLQRLGGTLEALKLQKLVYYCQAWSLAWNSRELFPQQIQAWAQGPVCRPLYDKHARQFKVNMSDVGGNELALEQQRLVDRVLKFYGPMTSEQLRDLTHSEEPWVWTRRQAGAVEGDRCEAIIEPALMERYYRDLAARAATT